MRQEPGEADADQRDPGGVWHDGIARPLTAQTEYLTGLPAIGDHPLRWLRGSTRAMQAYPVHVKGHPPLPTLILWTVRWTGLDQTSWAAALVIAAGTSATAAVAVTVRAPADEETARRAVPFLMLAPTVIRVATNVDALFLGVAAWAVAWVTLTATRPGPPSRPGGSAPYLSGACPRAPARAACRSPEAT